VRRFDDNLRRSNVPPELALPARYALCAFVDEAVLGTPWGSQSAWANQSLLVTFHKEAWGGEKFFQIVERAMQTSERDRELLKLLYICLALGFEGKFRAQDRGRDRLQEVRDELSRVIRDRDRGAAEAELSPHWRGVQDRRHALVRYVPFWIVASFAGLLALGAFAYLHASLGSKAAPVQARLARIGVGSPAANLARPPVPRAGPTIKELLSPEEQAGELEVVEDASGTTIVLAGERWFPSGSAALGDTRYPVLERVATVLAQASGPIEVVGHTDDVPLRSFRFKDNYDLSRQRAVEVQRLLLLGDPPNPYCCQTRGAGPDEPRHVPPTDPANRARNRRVEIRIAGG
jgi:type VI secretion system protein ImpK